MNIVPLFIFDRDEYAAPALASLRQKVHGLDDRIVIVDDRPHKLGFAGAIKEGWHRLTQLDPPPDYVFHMEGDFVFNEDIDAQRLADVLRRNTNLVQVSLKRQPWSDDERAAGGVIEASPDDFQQWADTLDYWVEHRRYFTTNPSVYHIDLCHQGWPQVRHSEGIFTHRLLRADRGSRGPFAIYGQMHDPPRVTHIGGERTGHGY